MKLSFLLIMLTFLIVNFVSAQQIIPKNKDTAKNYIDIDRLNPKNTYLWKLKYNKVTVLRILNVNKFVFKNTSAEQTGINFFTDMPVALSGIKLPSFTNQSIPSNSKALPDNDQGAEKKSLDTNLCNFTSPDKLISFYLAAQHKTLVDSLKELYRIGEACKFLAAVADTIGNIKDDPASSWGNIEKRKQDILTGFSIRAKNLSIDTNSITFLSGYKDFIVRADSLLSAIELNTKFLSNKIKKIIEPCSNYDTTEKYRKWICLDPCKNKKDYYLLLDDILKVRKYFQSIESRIDDFNSDFEKAKTLVSDLKAIDKDGKVALLQKSYDQISYQNYNYIADEFIADKDVHDMTLKINSENPVGYNQPQTRTIKIKGLTTGGVKVDFSTGLFFNFGNEDFLGPDYYYEKIDSTNKQIQKGVKSKKSMLSIGALAHAYIRSTCFIKPALSLGISTTTSFESANIHYGVSALLGKAGKPNRIVITFGGTLREVDLLNQRYSLNTNYTDLPDTVPLSKFFPKSGWFFAITYNFFSSSSK